jgi:hypothetical protein
MNQWSIGSKISAAGFRLTVSYAINRSLQITVGLLKGEYNILISPAGKHLLDGRDFGSILLLQYAYFALIFN